MTAEPIVVCLKPPLTCAACPHLASHEVDGTSVCRAHLREAYQRAKEKRQQTEEP